MSHKDLMIGILSPGDMGHTVGNVLRENGARVITCLEGRSQRTEKLTEDAGIEIVDSYPALVEQADLLLSILVPAQALPTATKVASALASTNTSVLYVDCNAIAPETTRQIERVAEFQLSQSERYESLSQSVARIPMKSRRWVGEMEEIAKSFENVGLTPKIIQGAADVYRLMGSTTLADRTPEDTTPFPSLEETVTELVKKSKKG